MKAYTDLEQSKKLGEILPLESADMLYYCNKSNNTLISQCPFIRSFKETDTFSYLHCWSLAALSEFILPYISDDDGNNYKFYLSKDGLDRWIAYYKSDDVSIHICEESDNMIDVILEMVCWLKKKKNIFSMKSYTDIEQSKKLAEILPLESADACWTNHKFSNILSSWRLESTSPTEYKSLLDYYYVQGYLIEPAWSLAVLLDVLPSASLDSSDDHHYRVHCNKMFTEWYDNAINACVEMIEKLHKQMIYDFNNS